MSFYKTMAEYFIMFIPSKHYYPSPTFKCNASSVSIEWSTVIYSTGLIHKNRLGTSYLPPTNALAYFDETLVAK